MRGTVEDVRWDKEGRERERRKGGTVTCIKLIVLN